MSNTKKAAIEVSKERRDGSGQESVELPYGVTAKIVPVPPQLIEEVTSKIKDPEVPIWHNEDKGRDEPNPNDPDYLKALDEANTLRGIASVDAFALFGIDLEAMPEDDKWLRKLLFMEKRGLIDLSDYDLDDPDELEFVYKRYVALNGNVLNVIVKASGVSEEEVQAAEASFPGQEEG